MRKLFVFFALNASFCFTTFSQDAPQAELFLWRYPTISKDGKEVSVSADEFIKHHLEGVKTKYKLIAVPDG